MTIDRRQDRSSATHAAVVHAIETCLTSAGWVCDRYPPSFSPMAAAARIAIYLFAKHYAACKILTIRIADHPYDPLEEDRYAPWPDMDFRLTDRKQVSEPGTPIILPLSDRPSAAEIALHEVQQRVNCLVQTTSKETER